MAKRPAQPKVKISIIAKRFPREGVISRLVLHKLLGCLCWFLKDLPRRYEGDRLIAKIANPSLGGQSLDPVGPGVGRYGYRDWETSTDRKSTRLNSSHSRASRMPSSA